MKKISILIPTFNEEENVELLTDCIKNELKTFLPKYDYEIIFIDNHSTDKTQDIIRKVCKNLRCIVSSKRETFSISNFEVSIFKWE